MPQKAVVSVINDLSTDQRVHKVCSTLQEMGFDVLLIGRKLKGSSQLTPRGYQTHRMHLLFEKGPLFYAEYNLRLFFFLIFRNVQLLVSNDLDTLLSNYLVSKIRKVPLAYDSHEYYTGVPELNHKPFIKRIWKSIEKWIFPKLNTVYTVSASLAHLYTEEYKVAVQVIRNVPYLKRHRLKKTKLQLNLPEDKKIILYQGAVNVDRGLELAIEAMAHLDHELFLIIGTGNIIDQLKLLVRQHKLNDKVKFMDQLPFEQLEAYTLAADLGLILDHDTNINYRYCLPNRLFDYIHAGLPVLASPLIEIREIIYRYNIGETIDNRDPEHVAEKIRFMLYDPEKRKQWKENAPRAAMELCWENESEELKKIYKHLV